MEKEFIYVFAIIGIIVAGLFGGYIGNNIGIEKGISDLTQAKIAAYNLGYKEGGDSVVIPEPNYDGYVSEDLFLALEEEYTDLKTQFKDEVKELDAWDLSKEYISDNFVKELELDDEFEEEDYTYELIKLEKDLDEDDGDWAVYAKYKLLIFDENNDFLEEREFEVEFELRESGDIRHEDFSWI